MVIKIIRKAPAVAVAPIVKDAIRTQPSKRQHGEQLDAMCVEAVKFGSNGFVSWWLIASYLYYIHDMSIISDHLYDSLAKNIIASWDRITHHHKDLITRADLDAGSLYRLKAEEYPAMTKGAARNIVKGEWGVEITER